MHGDETNELSLQKAILLLLGLSALLAINSSDNWRYIHDDNGRRFSAFARSHLEVGLSRTGGHDFFYDRRSGALLPYGHHPPGLGMLLAGWFWLWGNDSPFAARALAALFHLLSGCLVFALIVRYFHGRPGLIAAFAFTVIPMSSFFGKMVGYEPFQLLFMISSLVCYWRWAEEGTPGWLVLSLLIAGVATVVGWMILFALVAAAADAGWRYWHGEGTRFAVGSIIILTVGLVAFLAVAVWLASGPAGGQELVSAALFRLRFADDYSWWRWLGKMIDYNRRYFTEPVLLSSVVLVLFIMRDLWKGRSLAPRERLLVVFGVTGLLPVIIFPNGARYHAYWQFCLLPYAVLSLASVLDRIGPHLTVYGRRLLHAGIVIWLVSASAFTLWHRYTRPSGYVARMVNEWQFYL